MQRALPRGAWVVQEPASLPPACRYSLGGTWQSRPDWWSTQGSSINTSPACFAFAPVLQGLKVAIVEGHDIGGTCVNRGCVPSKALLAASNEVRS